MKKIIDVTNKVEFNGNDDELLPIVKCICGYKFGAWEFYISIYQDRPYECPNCGAKLFFGNSIKVYQVLDEMIEI